MQEVIAKPTSPPITSKKIKDTQPSNVGLRNLKLYILKDKKSKFEYGQVAKIKVLGNLSF